MRFCVCVCVCLPIVSCPIRRMPQLQGARWRRGRKKTDILGARKQQLPRKRTVIGSGSFSLSHTHIHTSTTRARTDASPHAAHVTVSSAPFSLFVFLRFYSFHKLFHREIKCVAHVSAGGRGRGGGDKYRSTRRTRIEVRERRTDRQRDEEQ